MPNFNDLYQKDWKTNNILFYKPYSFTDDGIVSWMQLIKNLNTNFQQ